MMLEELLHAMQGVHRRRRIRRRAAGAAFFLLLTALMTWMLSHSSTRSAPQVAGNNRPSIDSVPPAQIASRFEIVQTDPAIAQRLGTTSAPNVEWLDDQSLLSALNELHRPAGLIRADGKTWLTRSVVDPQDGTNG